MYTIIIADDEEIERKALQLLFIKEFPDVEIVALAENGVELVAAVAKYDPDLAIVDVNMPGINGIDAIDLLKARGVRTRFIVNTAYSEFEYVQRALTLKIDAYILKPEKRETIIKTIRSLCDAITETRFEKQNKDQMKELYQRIHQVIESEIMFSIFAREPAADNFNIYCEMHGLSFYNGVIVSLIPVESTPQSLIAVDRAELRKNLQTCLQSSCTFLANITSSNICLLIFVPEQYSSSEWQVWLKDVLCVALNHLMKRNHIELQAGVGSMTCDFGRIWDSYQESLIALKSPARDPVHFYRTSLGSGEVRVSLDDLSAEIVLNLLAGNTEAIDKAITRELIGTGNPKTIVDHKRYAILWNRCIEQINKHSTLTPEVMAFCRTVYKELNEALEMVISAPIIRTRFQQLASLLIEQSRLTSNVYVVQALKYIENHFSQDLSLDVVADEIGISPFYLSRLIKQELGLTFVEYLTQVRLSEATKLVEHSKLSIQEIAERTGYLNATYFCRIFKKHTGQTIGEIRKNLWKNQF